MDFIDGVRAFVSVANTGSFTEASAQLGISNKLVSKYVANLEGELGARLFHRTTRALSLTARGEEYLGEAVTLLDAYQRFRHLSTESQPTKIRITAPLSFGEDVLLREITRFQETHPYLYCEIHLSDEKLDLAKGGYDFALRFGRLPNSSMIARKLGEIRLCLAAAPSYLARAAAIQTSEDLSAHAFITDTNGGIRHHLSFQEDGEAKRVALQSRIAVNGARATAKLAIAGQGIIVAPDLFLLDAFADNSLTKILPELEIERIPVNLLHLPSPVRSNLHRAFADHLSESIKALTENRR